MPICKELVIEKKDPFLFYKENKKLGSCFLPRPNENKYLIGLEVEECLISLDALQSSIKENPNSFHTGFISYNAFQESLPFLIKTKLKTYSYPRFFWLRYKKWLEVHGNAPDYEYHYYDSKKGHLNIEELKSYFVPPMNKEEKAFYKDDQLLLSEKKATYIESVKNIKERIKKGECYQVNYSLQIKSKKTALEPFEVFEKYYQKAPSNYFSYFHLPGLKILSFSPELFFEKEGNKILAQPIKGTAPRTEKNKQELLNSKKEKAELFMITDLFRNDFYKICEDESVRVKKKRNLMSLNHLYHMYSEIEGRLNDKEDMASILPALFPSGSITGCPKIRSQEIIQELENYDRGIYTGSIGYHLGKKLELNVAIRTAIYSQDHYYYSIGSGIVYDSLPEKEWQECLLKAKSFLEALS